MRYTEAGDTKRAMIAVRFLRDDGSWEEIVMQVDTAADVSVLPYDFATKLKYVGLQSPLLVKEVVGSVAAVKTTVVAEIMGKQIELPIISSYHIDYPLLGVASFLDNFEVTLKPQGFSIRPAS